MYFDMPYQRFTFSVCMYVICFAAQSLLSGSTLKLKNLIALPDMISSVSVKLTCS